MKKILIHLMMAGCFMVHPAVLLAADYYVSASSRPQGSVWEIGAHEFRDSLYPPLGAPRELDVK